jgi:hypothetical protein
LPRDLAPSGDRPRSTLAGHRPGRPVSSHTPVGQGRLGSLGDPAGGRPVTQPRGGGGQRDSRRPARERSHWLTSTASPNRPLAAPVDTTPASASSNNPSARPRGHLRVDRAPEPRQPPVRRGVSMIVMAIHPSPCCRSPSSDRSMINQGLRPCSPGLSPRKVAIAGFVIGDCCTNPPTPPRRGVDFTNIMPPTR